jgi:preprotein translocase subunit YajC
MIHHAFLFLAQAASPAATPQSSPNSMGPTLLVYLLCFGVIFYFMSIRPQNKKRKEQEALVDSLKTGDKVVTTGGIHGMISNVKETTVLVKVADNVKLEVNKSAVVVVAKRSEDAVAAS